MLTLMQEQTRDAIFRDGEVRLAGPVDWPDGTRLVVTAVLPDVPDGQIDGHVIVIPEPSTWMLLGLGSLALLMSRFRRHQ